MVRNAWRSDSYDWCYLGSDGRAYRNTWKYLADSSGTFWYYFDDGCRITRNAWAWGDSSDWGYLNSAGHGVYGWNYLKDGDGQYYWFYFNGVATMQRNQWFPDSTSRGYVNEKGRAIIGWTKINSYWYYFNSSASMVTGWLTYNGYRYYLYKAADYGSFWEGKLAQYGWETIGGTPYYFRSSINDVALGDEGAKLESGYFQVHSVNYYWFDSVGHRYTRSSTLRLGDESLPTTRNSLASNYQLYSRGTYWANCLSFALDKVPQYDDERDWTWAWGVNKPTIAECQTWLRNNTSFINFSTTTPSAGPYMIAYGSNGRVFHFARVNASGSIYAKWGHLEIFKHSTIDPYKSSGGYGSILFYAY